MRILNIAMTFAALALTAGALQAQDLYKIDSVHSGVQFRIKHLNTTYVYGRFNDISGSFKLDPDNLKSSEIDVTVQVGTVDTKNADRDTHLKSPDFFESEKFPTATFKSTSIEKGKKEDRLELHGNLTIHGVTKPIVAELEYTGEGESPFNDHRKGLEAIVVIKRSDFGVGYMPELLSDDVTLLVSLQGVRE